MSTSSDSSTGSSTSSTTPTTQSRSARLAGRRTRIAEGLRPYRIPLLALLALFFYALPLLELPVITTPDTDFGGVLFIVATYVLVALGLNIVVGYAGLLDLGLRRLLRGRRVHGRGADHGAREHARSCWTIPIAVIVAMVSGIILGAPTLRVRGDYLAIVTLGFGEIIRLTAINLDWLGGARGISGVPGPPDVCKVADGTRCVEPFVDVPHLNWDTGVPLVDLKTATGILDFGVLDLVPYYWLALTVIIVVLFADKLIKNSRVGRAWEATREDEDAAELMGVPDLQVQAARLRDGRLRRRPVRRAVREQPGLRQPAVVPAAALDPVPRRGRRRRAGQPLGRHRRRGRGGLPPRALPRASQDWRVLVFGLALMILAIYRPQGTPAADGARSEHDRSSTRSRPLEEGSDRPGEPGGQPCLSCRPDRPGRARPRAPTRARGRRRHA